MNLECRIENREKIIMNNEGVEGSKKIKGSRSRGAQDSRIQVENGKRKTVKKKDSRGRFQTCPEFAGAFDVRPVGSLLVGGLLTQRSAHSHRDFQSKTT
jgi:hypothetical protein